jgi:hypothetical protein
VPLFWFKSCSPISVQLQREREQSVRGVFTLWLHFYVSLCSALSFFLINLQAYAGVPIHHIFRYWPGVGQTVYLAETGSISSGQITFASLWSRRHTSEAFKLRVPVAACFRRYRRQGLKILVRGVRSGLVELRKSRNDQIP